MSGRCNACIDALKREVWLTLPNGSATKVTASVTISREVQHVSLTQPLRRCGNAPLGLFTARSSGTTGGLPPESRDNMTTANPYPQGRLGEVWQRGYDGKPRTPTSERGSDPHLSARVWRAKPMEKVTTSQPTPSWSRRSET